jgi:hypothetical protein
VEHRFSGAAATLEINLALATEVKEKLTAGAKVRSQRLPGVARLRETAEKVAVC